VAELSLPERIVYAAETAIVEASAEKHETELKVDSIEGFPHDLAKASAAAVLQVLADSAKGSAFGTAMVLRHVADQVAAVKAL
jgi:hypothetical protein